MNCPNENCRTKNGTQVIDSRFVANINKTRRRRVCKGCGYRFTTYELTLDDLNETDKQNDKLRKAQTFISELLGEIE